MEKEIRLLDQSLSIDSESRKVEGYALLFNKESKDLGGFTELIEPNSLDGVIERSDVLALLNHNETRGILARSKNGKGSLKLSVDDRGLKYEFDSPKTGLGDELIEMLKREDITESSFSFTIEKDEWKKGVDGQYVRTIKQFKKLYDVSPVTVPAYEDTKVTLKRFLDAKAELDKVEEVPVIEEIREEPVIAEEVVVEETTTTTIIEEERKETEAPENVEVRNEIPIIEEQKNKKINMENVRLLKLINKISENRQLDENEMEFLNYGKSEFRKSGISPSGNIQFPLESRSGITATGTNQGIENVPEVKFDILTPLYANLVLTQAGAQVLTGLVGDISIPTFTGNSVLWKGENAAAVDGAGTFGEVTLKPKRLTAYCDVSKQFLLQDSNSAEEMLKNDIMTAISQKIESTLLGNTSGTTQPTGIFYNYNTGSTTGASYTVVTGLESAVEAKNVMNYTFVMNPKAKFKFKASKINEGKMVYDGNQLDGITALSTNNVYQNGIICGDFRDLIIGIWGIDLTVDPYTQAANGYVRLVVNAYVDAAWRRDSYAIIDLS